MQITDWLGPKHSSPFFLNETDNNVVSDIYNQIENGDHGDWAIAKAIHLKVITPKIKALKNQLRKLHKLHGTTAHDLKMYGYGFFSPLILIDSSFTWHYIGQSQAKQIIAENMFFKNAWFSNYLHEQLPRCFAGLTKTRSSSSIFDIIRLEPPYNEKYLEVGLEASHDAFILYADRVARLHNTIEYGFNRA